MSDLETLSAEDYGKLTGTDQRTRWRKATREAEWQAAQGKMGSLILKQRSRGHRADRLAIAFLVALIVTVLFGLVYYVVVPLWQQLNDAERRAYEAQVEILDGQLADIERERNDLWKGLVASLALTATPVESGVTASLGDLRVLPDGTTLVAAGEDGAITRSGDAGASWDPVESGVTAFLTNLRVLPDGTTLVAVGGGGAITRSTDAGGSWDPVESGVTADLIDLNVLPDGTTLVAVAWGGAILILDDRYFRELDGMDLLRGSEGDGQVDKAFDDLPATVRGTPTRTEFRRAFYEAVLDRPTLLSQRQTAQTAADEISTGGFSLAQRREDFAAFMVSCRSDKAGADTDKGCADAYVALRASETPGPWQVLAERVPQAVLILFLLATLGGLYRYNLRLAGFYHARADALELLGEGKGATDADILDRLGTALAADKVEFGKGNTPSDQATELAKAVMARSSG